MEKPVVQKEIELTIEKMAFGGQAIARADRFVYFVDDALPGEVVKAVVYKRKKDFACARAVEVLKASPDRVPASCPWMGRCGGCALRHCAPAAQARLKHDIWSRRSTVCPGRRSRWRTSSSRR